MTHIGNKSHKTFSCSQVISSGQVPYFLKELFIQNSKNLNSTQKDVFARFLQEFQNIFSEETAGNCEVLEHVINLNDSIPN